MADESGGGGMRLTGAGKAVLFLVGLAVLGYVGWTYRARLTGLGGGSSTTSTAPAATPPTPASTPAAPAPQKGVIAKIRQTGVMRVGMEPDAPPLHFIDARKHEDEFDFRFAALIADSIGAKRVEVVIMAGRVPDPSIKGAVWSNGCLDFGLCMIVHEGMAATFRSPANLAGKRVAIYGDPFAAEEIKAHPVPEGNFDLIDEVNSAIDKFPATPQYAELMREYLSSSSEVFMKPVAGRKTYPLRAGDALTKLATTELKDINRWKKIWDLNRDRVANENLIDPRLVLLMPRRRSNGDV